MQITDSAVVYFHYALINDQGEVLDGTKGGDPIPYLHGCHNIVPGLEKAMDGRSADDHFRITLTPLEAYGERDEDKVYDVERQLFANMPELSEGLMFHMTNESGEDELVSVVEIHDDLVTVDANHPYAGESLTFDVEIVSIRNATPAEMEAGQAIAV
ncbi:FKBP-type peptidyl-prolyl cis-trans isomerase [Neptunomonas antarctica]|uniref:Peptidyl-prolyl cis-trans isomerase n=1 Tax=Neptunomonas antarctica TaxID=619304 RepID=A0A1N7P9V2_9GAMM|nr:FKBP-type peptidyl-prolyl cis-trans isomerase [Neptunomonas antarctica]SIT07415.1 FKBP-type peptidyl-prolyl cis-trans isomerase SlyD [Neptunomonas antarctica]